MTDGGALANIRYDDLYARWEEGNWRALEIDLSRDPVDWDRLSDVQQRSMRWQFGMFMKGEAVVAEDLSPYIDAAPMPEQKYFLATQQVDEARHAIFFSRFFNEVLGAGSDITGAIDASAADLNWGYLKTFARLDQISDELRRDRSPPKLAQAITLYHLIVEAQLAQPGQHYIERYTTSMNVLPGLREGLAHVSRDEQRHVAFGVKLLGDLFARSDECKAAVAELLREVLRYSMCVFVPPGFDRSYTEELGFTLEEIYGFGFRSFETKMRTAGFPIDELPTGVYPLDPEVTPEERGRVLVAMLEAGLSADPGSVPDSSVGSQRLLFDLVRRGIDREGLNGHDLTVQWRFVDASPWRLVIDRDGSNVSAGEARNADVTLECTWAEWVGLVLTSADIGRAVLQRRLKVRGSPRQLLRLRSAVPT